MKINGKNFEKIKTSKESAFKKKSKNLNEI